MSYKVLRVKALNTVYTDIFADAKFSRFHINNLCKNIRGNIFSRIELTELYALVEIICDS